MTPDRKWIHGFLAFFWPLLVGVLLCACSDTKAVKKTRFFDEWKAKAETSKAHSPSPRTRVIDLPERKKKAPPKAKVKAEPERALPTQKITMTMRNIDVSAVLRALARAANQNMMMNDRVKGITNINVKATPWDQVFKGLLRTHGLTYAWEGDIIRVMTLTDIEHDRKLEQARLLGKELKQDAKELEPYLTRVIKIDYADAQDLGKNLEKLLTPPEVPKAGTGAKAGLRQKATRRKPSVNVDKHNNALIIHASREDISRMIALVEKLDRPTPQVLIEAYIIEATRETARELGIQWGGLTYAPRGSANYWVRGGDGTLTGITGNTNIGTPGNQLFTAGGAAQRANPSSGLGAYFPIDVARDLRGLGSSFSVGFLAEKVGNFVLSTQLSALESESKLNILSSPSITTVDNQTAMIESGREVPFQTTTGAGAEREVEIEWKKAVLKLEVTPHVVDDKLLKLKIVTTKDDLDFTRTVLGNPTIITKRADTTVMLLDGQTVVIGGLSQGTDRGSETGLPWIKDIPFLGYIFKAEGKGNVMDEVLIFITPHILKQKKVAVRNQKDRNPSGKTPQKKTK